VSQARQDNEIPDVGNTPIISPESVDKAFGRRFEKRDVSMRVNVLAVSTWSSMTSVQSSAITVYCARGFSIARATVQRV
jgi:hypothetical protein